MNYENLGCSWDRKIKGQIFRVKHWNIALNSILEVWCSKNKISKISISRSVVLKVNIHKYLKIIFRSFENKILYIKYMKCFSSSKHYESQPMAMAFEPEYHILIQGILVILKIFYHYYHHTLHVYSQPIIT